MVTYLLGFDENIRFSMTLSEYQEHSYPLEKTAFVFLDLPKKFHVTLVGCSGNNRGVFLYVAFPKHYFRILPGISLETFSEYTGNISFECSTNTSRTCGSFLSRQNKKTCGILWSI